MLRLVALVLLLTTSLPAALFDLSFENLTPSLGSLTAEERKIVDRSIGLIRKGENTLALAQLSTISKANPKNSALHVLVSYALLQIGNKLGAFDAAQKAEQAPDHTGYVCLFLAKVAYFTGEHAVCKREIHHVKSTGQFKEDVKQLEAQVAKSAK